MHSVTLSGNRRRTCGKVSTATVRRPRRSVARITVFVPLGVGIMGCAVAVTVPIAMSMDGNSMRSGQVAAVLAVALDDESVGHMNRTVGVPGNLRIVSHEHDRHSGLV